MIIQSSAIRPGPRLCDFASWPPLAAGASSRNLGHTFAELCTLTRYNKKQCDHFKSLGRIVNHGGGNFCDQPLVASGIQARKFSPASNLT